LRRGVEDGVGTEDGEDFMGAIQIVGFIVVREKLGGLALEVKSVWLDIVSEM
jgi:hypothetical protein